MTRAAESDLQNFVQNTAAGARFIIVARVSKSVPQSATVQRVAEAQRALLDLGIDASRIALGSSTDYEDDLPAPYVRVFLGQANSPGTVLPLPAARQVPIASAKIERMRSASPGVGQPPGTAAQGASVGVAQGGSSALANAEVQVEIANRLLSINQQGKLDPQTALMLLQNFLAKPGQQEVAPADAATGRPATPAPTGSGAVGRAPEEVPDYWRNADADPFLRETLGTRQPPRIPAPAPRPRSDDSNIQVPQPAATPMTVAAFFDAAPTTEANSVRSVPVRASVTADNGTWPAIATSAPAGPSAMRLSTRQPSGALSDDDMVEAFFGARRQDKSTKAKPVDTNSGSTAVPAAATPATAVAILPPSPNHRVASTTALPEWPASAVPPAPPKPVAVAERIDSDTRTIPSMPLPPLQSPVPTAMAQAAPVPHAADKSSNVGLARPDIPADAIHIRIALQQSSPSLGPVGHPVSQPLAKATATTTSTGTAAPTAKAAAPAKPVTGASSAAKAEPVPAAYTAPVQLATAAPANNLAALSVPVGPTAKTEAATPAPTWYLDANKTLRENLDDWSSRAGYQLKWKASNYIQVMTPRTYNTSFLDVVKSVGQAVASLVRVEAYPDSNPPEIRVTDASQ